MRRLTSAKIQTNKPTTIIVICGNDFPLKATYSEERAKRELLRLEEWETTAMKEAKRQKIPVGCAMRYHIQRIPIIEEEK